MASIFTADFWKGAWNKTFRSRWSMRRALSSFLMQGSSVGMQTSVWTDSRYEMVRQFKHWVYVAIDRIATEVAMHQPNISIIRRAGQPSGNKQRYLSPYARSKALTPLMHHQELEAVRDDHPVCRLLEDPNDPDTSFDMWYETVLFLLLTGSAYWWMPRNALGYPMAIWVLPSHWVWANIGKDGAIDTYQVRPVEGNYLRMDIPAEEIIHFRKKSPISKLDGFSPQTAGAQWIDCQTSIDRSRWFSFRNGVFAGLAFTFDEGRKLPDEDMLDRIESKFMSRYSGEMQANKPMFIPPGMGIHKVNMSPEEMNFNESGEQLRDMILSLFGVPAVIAQIMKDLTYGSVLAARAGFYYGTINPLYRFLSLQITEKLGWLYGKDIRIWWEDRTPQDPETVEESIKTDFACGAISPNEIRRMRGREPYPHGGDDPLVQGAMMTLPFFSGGKILSIHDNQTPSATTPLAPETEEDKPDEQESSDNASS